ncbi:MAG: GNAT family N-acetyltransferase [Candidatus Roizmanbacteria bacterium]
MITRTTKSGKEVTLRPPIWGDVQIYLQYINTLSREDTFITFSGEQQTYSQEEKYVKECIDKISKGDMVKLMCFVDGQLAGVCDAVRDVHNRTRQRHCATIGLTVTQEYRGLGLGEILLKECIRESKEKLHRVSILHLDVYSPNLVAQKLYKKVGFVEHSRLPKGVSYKGTYHDLIGMHLQI